MNFFHKTPQFTQHLIASFSLYSICNGSYASTELQPASEGWILGATVNI